MNFRVPRFAFLSVVLLCCSWTATAGAPVAGSPAAGTPADAAIVSKLTAALAVSSNGLTVELKRAATPIVGLGGVQGESHGEVIASVVSTADEDLGYTSPPGVIDVSQRRGAAFEFGSQQINERSLRLIVRDLRVGERAEAFLRFADAADKNFLQYRRLRVWARGR